MSREPDRQNRIVANLRQLIVSGKLAPGERVPTRSRVQKQCGASPVTVQRAFDRLCHDGFIQSRGRHGSFVSEFPPHLFSYWLVFMHDVPPSSSPFRDALIAEAAHMTRSRRESFLVYPGQNGQLDSDNYRQLLYDVQTHRTAGLVFASAAEYWSSSTLLQHGDVAHLAISHMPRTREEMPVVALDRYSFIDKALDCLRSERRRRVAVIAPSASLPATCREYLFRSAAERGIRMEPYWVQFAAFHYAQSARNLVHLLLSGAPRNRPNGLIVMDDSFVSHAAEGVHDAGLSVPEDLLLIAHTNFPYPTRSPVPVKRLGYDIPALLDTCVQTLNSQRNGSTRTPGATVGALLEEELERAGTKGAP